jgi:hypothetical protein
VDSKGEENGTRSDSKVRTKEKMCSKGDWHNSYAIIRGMSLRYLGFRGKWSGFDRISVFEGGGKEVDYAVNMWCVSCSALQINHNLSTNGFMLGLRRFIAWQGQSKVIYSESGTNFFGAENLFKSLDWTKITQEASITRIHWKYTPLPGGVDGGSE